MPSYPLGATSSKKKSTTETQTIYCTLFSVEVKYSVKVGMHVVVLELEQC